MKGRYRHLSTKSKFNTGYEKKEIKWWQLAIATIVVSVLGAFSTGASKRAEKLLVRKAGNF